MIKLLLCSLTIRPLFQVIQNILCLKIITNQLIHIQQANADKHHDDTITSFSLTFPNQPFSFMLFNIKLIHIEYNHNLCSQHPLNSTHTQYQFDFQKMEIGKHFKNGFLLVHSPFQFKHKHLSLSKQRKDKQIKKERQELQRKRKDFEEIKGKWMKEEQEYKVFSEKRKEENLKLIMQQEGLKRDLFKLSIRKDQIESKNNPDITINKATIIKKYLKCVPFTAGKRLQSIQFWKSQARYMNLRFLLELAVDRFFGRSTIQKSIIGNLSRIVFCKKIKFGEQWIMFCIKQPIRVGSRFCYKTSKKSNKSLYHPDNIISSPDEKKFELIIYAISGTYFHLNKFYTEEELKSWIDVSAYTEPVINKHHRLSVADNLAKINALRALSDSSMMQPNLFQEFKKQSIKQIKDQFKIISEQAVASSQNNSDLNDDTQDENLSQATSQIEKKCSNQDCTPQKTDENISESEAETPTTNLRTRKSVQMKSWFFIRGKNQSFVCKFNRQFLSGYSSILFPQKDPLINVIVNKDKKQLYLLQEYIQNTSKKLILDMVVARFKLKMKIKAELKKCLYYKKEIIEVCQETIMAEEKQIYLPCLFVLKKRENSLAHEIYISCDSLTSHPQIENGLQIKALLHSVAKERQDFREQKIIARNSHLKNIKSSSMRNRQSKRRSNSRNPSKMISIQHDKSNFSATKKLVQNWIAFSPEIIEKYKTFMSKHIISIKKRSFISKEAINRKMFNIIKIQSKFRMVLSKKILTNARQMIKIKCVWRRDLNILITASLISNEKIVKVYFEKVEIGCPEPVQCFQYEMINWDTICDTIESIQHEGTFNNVTQNALELIKLKIERQTRKRMQQQKQKPERYKRMIESFLFMLSLRFKARKNIFFIKKMIIKERIFVLLIRRDRHVKSLLQCNLYDMILPKDIHDGKNSQSAFSKQKELGSEYGSHKQAARSRPELDDKIFKYQKIYLMEQYFQNINHKQIVDEFYIDKGVFLLKPPKTFNIFYVDRLNTLDMNSEEFFKEFSTFEKQDLQRINQERASLNQSSNSLKKLIILNNSSLFENNSSSKAATQTQSKEALLNFSKTKPRQESKQSSRKQKKTSIEKGEKEIFSFLKSNFLKENLRNSQMLSKKSVAESVSGKATRQIFQIVNNSHESIVYYSIYKADNVFFYLEFFIVTKTVHQNSYHEVLHSLEKFRLYKKQLEEANSNLFYKKLAAWAHENDEQLIRTQQKRQKPEDMLSKKGQSTNNLVTLQFFSALIGANKRLSYEVANSLIFDKEKQTRTNTLTL